MLWSCPSFTEVAIEKEAAMLPSMTQFAVPAVKPVAPPILKPAALPNIDGQPQKPLVSHSKDVGKMFKINDPTKALIRNNIGPVKVKGEDMTAKNLQGNIGISAPMTDVVANSKAFQQNKLNIHNQLFNS